MWSVVIDKVGDIVGASWLKLRTDSLLSCLSAIRPGQSKSDIS